MVFVIRMFDQSTGHVETVSQIFPDFDGTDSQKAARRAAVVDRFAAEDTSTDDTYWSCDWPLEP